MSEIKEHLQVNMPHSLKRTLGVVVGISVLATVMAPAAASASAVRSPQAFQPACDWRPTVDAHVTGATFRQNSLPVRTGEYNVCPAIGEGFIGDDVTILCASVNANGYGWFFVDIERDNFKFDGWAPVISVYDPGTGPAPLC